MKEVILEFVRDDNVTLKADGTSANTGAELGILSLEGFDTPQIEIYNEKRARGDGCFTTHVNYWQRELKITVSPKTNSDSFRRKVLSFFNSKKEIKVIINYRGRTLWTVGRVSDRVISTNNVHRKSAMKIEILCDDPFLKNKSKNVASFQKLKKSFTLPLKSKKGTGFATGIISLSTEKWVENIGDGEVRPVITMTFGDVVTEPYIRLNDVLISFKGSYSPTDVVVIDCDKNTIAINNVLRFDLVNLESSITEFVLLQGDNYVKLGATTGESNVHCNMEFYTSWLGV